MYSLFSMSRMLKDKLINTVYHKKNIVSYKKVNRMNKIDTNMINNLFKLYIEPTKILNRIYLGNAYNASNFNCLKENNIGLIINITYEIPNYFEDHFKYYKIEIDDANGVKIGGHFDKVNKLIENYLQNETKNIFIHCFMGSSRSATLACIYYSYKFNKSIKESISYMKEKRNIININTSFIDDMHEWKEIQIKKKFEYKD